MLNHLCLLFLPNISLVIWTARLWMQPISDWVEYCLILKVFLIKFHLYFWRNSQNIFSVFLNFPLKYAYTLPYPPFRKYIFYRIFFVFFLWHCTKMFAWILFYLLVLFVAAWSSPKSHKVFVGLHWIVCLAWCQVKQTIINFNPICIIPIRTQQPGVSMEENNSQIDFNLFERLC